MKLLALPKSEITIIPEDISLEEKTFTYFLGDLYPSKEMADYIKILNKKCKIKRILFPPLLELSANEYNNLKKKKDDFQKISGGLTIPLKEDIIMDNFKINDCYIKSFTETENNIYVCEFDFRSIEKLD